MLIPLSRILHSFKATLTVMLAPDSNLGAYISSVKRHPFESGGVVAVSLTIVCII